MKKWLLRISLGILAVAAAFALFVVIAFRLANQTNGTLVSSGETRSYLLYVPKTYNPSTPTPLVVSIHGFAEWPAHQMQISRWNELADENGFIVVYPSGTNFPLRWRVSEGLDGETGKLVDVIFIEDLIDTLEQQYNIDPQRIYANGLSNGGAMSFALSCQLSDQIAAVGMVSGAFFYPWEACQPARPVPAIVFHGTDDPIVPFNGGPSRHFDLPFPVISVWVDEFAVRNQCTGTPKTLEPLGAVRGLQYTGCSADLVFYTIEGGGHTWPGGEPIPEWIAGLTNYDIEATRLMWDFFQQHPLSE